MPSPTPTENAPRGGFTILTQTTAAIWHHPDNRHRRIRRVLRYAAWQVSERTLRRPWTVAFMGGARIRCHPHSPISSAVIYYGRPDPEELAFVRDALRPEDTFVDVGANVGLYTVAALTRPGVRAVSFEPGQPARDRLEENLALNGMTDRAEVHAAGVSDTGGVLRFTRDRGPMNRLLEPDEVLDEPIVSVPVVTLDDVLATTPRVSVIKIDVEGFETQVLEGARDLLRRQRPALIMEVNDPEGLGNVFDDLGYTCVRYDESTRDLTEIAIGDVRGLNVIAVFDPDAWRSRLRGDRAAEDARPAGP